MPLNRLPLDELRQVCRHRLETCELWLRRLVDEKLRADFGADYVNSAMVSGQRVFNSDARNHVERRLAAEPRRYPRPIDTLMLDQLSKAICSDKVFDHYFETAFAGAFPLGAKQLLFTIERLKSLRNALAHANQFSVRQAEQAICYSGDIVESLKSYYKEIGMDQAYAAPSFVRFFDSHGNERYPTQTQGHLDLTAQPLYVGESIVMEIEVDASFDPNEYGVVWQVGNRSGGEIMMGHRFELTLESRHVDMNFAIACTVTSVQPWHRHGTFDASLWVTYQVRPLR